MSEHWAAVARAINQRMAELGLAPHELVERSRVSKAIVRELRQNTVQRRRSTRTLEALSIALEWNPGHLAAVLAGRRPPRIGEPAPRTEDDVPGRLAAIEHHLREITEKLSQVDVANERLGEINEKVTVLAEQLRADRKRPGR
ncbi:hypothetical protein EV193_112126 [Herbihabitans rhizosphaerae]|uniref:XRE family transcriptional regulator n=1 Tax=Herbihabitans rhizosphaerae TaxID=1872711 RepID=A0A4Q7KF50_9PSEU|nr:transcriptional regulator [Herbihabitans rhizosphaerae]RZS32492.1 hypothetical protein EV193_112126 [Herbihabitans rhizosphaerae]